MTDTEILDWIEKHVYQINYFDSLNEYSLIWYTEDEDEVTSDEYPSLRKAVEGERIT